MERYQALDVRHMWHPCSHMHDYEAYPAVAVRRARGVWLYTEDGRRILDAVSSWWVNLFGHGNRRIARAIAKQSKKLEHVIFANYTHEPASRLAAELSGLFDHQLPRVFFADNGSSAVEIALKMSYHFRVNTGAPERDGFGFISGAYHGETVGALSVGALGLYKRIYQPMLMNTAALPGPDCYRCPYGLSRETCNAECFSGTERSIRENAHLSAVIIEPMLQAADGMKMYPARYLIKLRALTRTLGIHLICDEIASGFGRTGAMMASHHASIVPDIVTVSKGLTGGFLPLSAVLVSEAMYQAFYAPYSENKAFLHSHSYTGNPIACAAANAVFALFRERDVLSDIAEKGAYIRERAMAIAGHPSVGEIRSLGMVTAIELVADKASKQPLDSALRTGYRIYREAEHNGVLLRNLGDILYFMPPYVISRREIDRMVDTALRAIRSILPE
ncbi:MAG: adenosylmethionine--8-amino-7-oxononanoate transaminase [Spirochaetota bacterium]